MEIVSRFLHQSFWLYPGFLQKENYQAAWLDSATGLENAKLEGVHLRLPGHGETGPTLEIFSYQEMEAHPPIMANYEGFTHIAFEVSDVEQTLQQALNEGAQKLGSISKKMVESVGELHFVYFRDPEGNIIEIQSWNIGIIGATSQE